jgi:hypothetical protein
VPGRGEDEEEKKKKKKSVVQIWSVVNLIIIGFNCASSLVYIDERSVCI